MTTFHGLIMEKVEIDIFFSISVGIFVFLFIEILIFINRNIKGVVLYVL